MNYNDMPHYEAETFIKNRLDTPLKPSLGINPGRNAPLIKSNDTDLYTLASWVFYPIFIIFSDSESHHASSGIYHLPKYLEGGNGSLVLVKSCYFSTEGRVFFNESHMMLI